MSEGELAEAVVPDAGEAPVPRSFPLVLQLTPIRLTLSSTAVIVNWRLSLRNAGETHIVALRVWSDVASAGRTAIGREEAGRPEMERAKLHQVEMLSPGVTAECSGEWHLPRKDAHLVKFGHVRNINEPRVLPVARFRMIGAGIAPTFTNFAIGSPAETEGGLPLPLLFDDSMQIFADLAAVQLS